MTHLQFCFQTFFVRPGSKQNMLSLPLYLFLICMPEWEDFYVFALSNCLREMMSVLIEDVRFRFRVFFPYCLSFILHFSIANVYILSPSCLYMLLQHHLHKFWRVLQIETDFSHGCCSGEIEVEMGWYWWERGWIGKAEGHVALTVVQKWRQGRDPWRGAYSRISQSFFKVFWAQGEYRKSVVKQIPVEGRRKRKDGIYVRWMYQSNSEWRCLVASTL